MHTASTRFVAYFLRCLWKFSVQLEAALTNKTYQAKFFYPKIDPEDPNKRYVQQLWMTLLGDDVTVISLDDCILYKFDNDRKMYDMYDTIVQWTTNIQHALDNDQRTTKLASIKGQNVLLSKAMLHYGFAVDVHYYNDDAVSIQWTSS